MTDFEKIRKEGRLLYEYIRGSQLYGLNTETSDIDTSGVFAGTKEEILGCFGYKAQVSDSRHDTVWFEIGELVRLLLKSNPTVLESLFIPEDKIITKPDSLMQSLLDNKEKFLSKQCFNPFFGYAKSQIEKARGLNKKIVNPITTRLTPYDFIYTFKGQGSTKFRDWLDNRGLHQEYCGLVNVPNMHDMYGVYYDFGTHIENNLGWKEDISFMIFVCEYFNLKTVYEAYDYISSLSPIGYRGVINLDARADEIRLSSVPDKNSRPICFIYYNKNGYSVHCRQYLEYQEWVKNRNQARYESNLEKNYDSKNMMHCFRMIHMAGEIAEGKGMILERTTDRQFLLDVRNHKFEYDEVIAMLEQEKDKMNNLMEQSTIPDKIDTDFVNSLMIKIREQQLGIA